MDADHPDIQVGPLKLWIHGLQFPEAQDYWDGNWLRATATCKEITIPNQPMIHLSEIAGLLEDCKKVYQTGTGTIELPTIEPNLSLKLTADVLGHISGEAELHPEGTREFHSY